MRIALRSSVCVLALAIACALPSVAPGARKQTACDHPTIEGTNGSDRLRGTRQDDVIAGFGGNDVLKGRRGNDVLCGDAGADRLNGGLFTDRVKGGGGRDRVRGGEGNDAKLNGGAGHDLIRGGNGVDRIKDPGTRAGDRIHGNDGNDVIRVGEKDGFCRCYGDKGGDDIASLMRYGPDSGRIGSKFFGGNGKDRLFGNGRMDGGFEDDRIKVGGRRFVVDNDDHILGGRDGDRISYVRDKGQDVIKEQLFGGDTIFVNGGDTVDAGLGFDHVVARDDHGAVTILGSQGEDRIEVFGRLTSKLVGGNARDVISAHSRGPARIFGGVNHDTLVGGPADDELSGGIGSDRLDGRGGFDICDGGSNVDLARNCERRRGIP